MTNTVPFLVPWLNLALSAIGSLVVLLILGRGLTISQTVSLGALAMAMLILTAGSLFQVNMFPVWAWVIVGTGGRATIVIVLLYHLLRPSRGGQRAVRAGLLEVELRKENEMRIEHERADQRLTDAAEQTEINTRRTADNTKPMPNVSRDAKATADNTQQIAEASAQTALNTTPPDRDAP